MGHSKDGLALGKSATPPTNSNEGDMDEHDKKAWNEFVSKPFDPSFDWREVAAARRAAASGPSFVNTYKAEDLPKSGRFS